MKKAVTTVPVVDVPNEGLISLLGKKVLLITTRYFYAGVLEGVNDTFVKLASPRVVLDVGDFDSKGRYVSFQEINSDSIYVTTTSIESFFESNRF